MHRQVGPERAWRPLRAARRRRSNPVQRQVCTHLSSHAAQVAGRATALAGSVGSDSSASRPQLANLCRRLVRRGVLGRMKAMPP